MAPSRRVGQLVGELAVAALGQPVPGQGGPQQGAAEMLELLAGAGPERDIGVQGEALPAGAPELLAIAPGGGGAQAAHRLAGARARGDRLLDRGGGVAGQKR